MSHFDIVIQSESLSHDVKVYVFQLRYVKSVHWNADQMWYRPGISTKSSNNTHLLLEVKSSWSGKYNTLVHNAQSANITFVTKDPLIQSLIETCQIRVVTYDVTYEFTKTSNCLNETIIFKRPVLQVQFLFNYIEFSKVDQEHIKDYNFQYFYMRVIPFNNTGLQCSPLRLTSYGTLVFGKQVNKRCSWVIQVPKYSYVRFHFRSEVYESNKKRCKDECKVFIELKSTQRYTHYLCWKSAPKYLMMNSDISLRLGGRSITSYVLTLSYALVQLPFTGCRLVNPVTGSEISSNNLYVKQGFLLVNGTCDCSVMIWARKSKNIMSLNTFLENETKNILISIHDGNGKYLMTNQNFSRTLSFKTDEEMIYLRVISTNRGHSNKIHINATEEDNSGCGGPKYLTANRSWQHLQCAPQSLKDLRTGSCKDVIIKWVITAEENMFVDIVMTHCDSYTFYKLLISKPVNKRVHITCEHGLAGGLTFTNRVQFFVYPRNDIRSTFSQNSKVGLYLEFQYRSIPVQGRILK